MKLVLKSLPVLALVACGRDGGGPSGDLKIATSALALTGVVDAEYTLAVYNGAGDLVWRKAGLRASRYGAPDGSLAYVGTCDASAGVADNRVELTMDALFDSAGAIPADRWQNPTANGPLVQTVDCVENADASVVFDLTIMRPAEQGFFDIGVTFDDIFCSAKIDCKDELLHNTAGDRAATVVMTLACTSGQGQPGGEPTWLHYSDVALKCGDVTTWIDPSVGPGQTGPRGPSLFEVATYRGQEAFRDLDKCYWNMALGVNLGPDAANCSLIAYATASSAAFDDEGATPANSTYPYIAYELALTDAAGRYTCSQHPLNGTPTGVTTGYTSTRGTRFPHQWECADDTTISDQRVMCDGLTLGDAGPATFTQSPGGVTFAVGDLKSPLMKLGGDRRLSDCCANPCPGCTTQPPR